MYFEKNRIAFHVVRVTERSISQGSKFVYFWAENMDYTVCITAKYERKTVFSFVRAVSFNSSFQDIFKERLETARKGDNFLKDCNTEFILGSVRVSAGPSGPWRTA